VLLFSLNTRIYLQVTGFVFECTQVPFEEVAVLLALFVSHTVQGNVRTKYQNNQVQMKDKVNCLYLSTIPCSMKIGQLVQKQKVKETKEY
jgi:hypothetical protein